MKPSNISISGGPIFDGERLHNDKAALFCKGIFEALCEISEVPTGTHHVDLDGDILSPGYVDLQVNGGGGVMFNHDPSVAALREIAQAHRTLGTTYILPTLITDIRAKTTAAISSVCEAVETGLPGIAGLHLEGPHLSVARKGAHDPALIREMDDDDLQELLAAKESLPVLKVTIAPESVTPDQVQALTKAGVLVSLGHSDASYATCSTYVDAGAKCATHLFNAMSQFGNREPGIVGCALDDQRILAGLIADGVHVHPASMRIAWNAKKQSQGIFLVTDAMAVAGTDHESFELGGRRINRSGGQLRLQDGTLAGADLNLTQAISVLVNMLGAGLEQALRAAIRTPAELCGLQNYALRNGNTRLSDVIRIKHDLTDVEVGIDL
ncbi:MAG: N-acetylglucosamine-6-phosphate deacetylase [Pseudomonadota bacterium]